MGRLTQKDEQGNWCLRGVRWEQLRTGQIITAKVSEILYGALWKLMRYEDTGLTPEEVIDGRLLTGWITVNERLPEKPKENPIFDNKPLELYLVSIKNVEYALRTFWNGESFTDGWSKLDVLAWMPLPEPYKQDEN